MYYIIFLKIQESEVILKKEGGGPQKSPFLQKNAS